MTINTNITVQLIIIVIINNNISAGFNASRCQTYPAIRPRRQGAASTVPSDVAISPHHLLYICVHSSCHAGHCWYQMLESPSCIDGVFGKNDQFYILTSCITRWARRLFDGGKRFHGNASFTPLDFACLARSSCLLIACSWNLNVIFTITWLANGNNYRCFQIF